MKKLLIKNIKGLVQVDETLQKPLTGQRFNELPVIENAWLAVEDGIIVAFGEMADWPGISDWSDLEVIDAAGKFVLPTWCDSHTHLVFAKDRSEEFIDRINGLSYEEIAAKGGGIINSAKKLRAMSEDELFEGAMQRLKEVILMGTGAIEIKSGYGLDMESELKMLKVIKRLKESSPAIIKATFLGAHAIPPEFKDNRDGYVDMIINEMIPAIAKEGLADYIDVFCESNYFTVREMEDIMEAGVKAGMKPKVHVNQFTSIGGVQAAIKYNAVSVDHLEVMEDADFKALQGSGTIATLLPSCSYFINIPYANAKKFMDYEIPIALATDFNPGSTPSGNIPLMLSFAAVNMKMNTAQCLNAVTVNGAFAMEITDKAGSIGIGKNASFIITNEIPSLHYIPYAFGNNHIESVFLNGERITK